MNPLDAFILGAITNPQIKSAVALILAHKFAAALVVFASSGVGANLLARALNMIPLGGWYFLVRGVFAGLSRVGDVRLGRPIWTPFEAFLERFILGTADAAREGLEADNEAGGSPEGRDKGVPPLEINPPPLPPPSATLQAFPPAERSLLGPIQPPLSGAPGAGNPPPPASGAV